MVVEGTWRPARAVVDRGAITRNVARLCAAVSPAALCAVVKANGYSHGALLAASAALDGGAAGLAVALVDEGEGGGDEGVDAQAQQRLALLRGAQHKHLHLAELVHAVQALGIFSMSSRFSAETTGVGSHTHRQLIAARGAPIILPINLQRLIEC